MINEIIELFFSTITILAFGAGMIWAILYISKRRYQKDKKVLKQIESIELKLKKICGFIWTFFYMFLVMGFSSLLAIGIKPIIYKLNTPLGWEYATFASYMIAICLWLLLSPFKRKKTK